MTSIITPIQPEFKPVSNQLSPGILSFIAVKIVKIDKTKKRSIAVWLQILIWVLVVNGLFLLIYGIIVFLTRDKYGDDDWGNGGRKNRRP